MRPINEVGTALTRGGQTQKTEFATIPVFGESNGLHLGDGNRNTIPSPDWHSASSLASLHSCSHSFCIKQNVKKGSLVGKYIVTSAHYLATLCLYKL